MNPSYISQTAFTSQNANKVDDYTKTCATPSRDPFSRSPNSVISTLKSSKYSAVGQQRNPGVQVSAELGGPSRVASQGSRS